jgi:hypothetical protein
VSIGEQSLTYLGKCGQPLDIIQDMQFDDEHSRHLKLQVKDCTSNDRYHLMAQPTSHEKLEESLSSRILEYQESHRPRSPPEITHQDKVFLAENPECLAVERGKRGRDDGNINKNLQLPRNDDSSTISNSYSKSFESTQPDVTHASARTYIPCTADLRIENEGSDHRSTSVRSTMNPASKLEGCRVGQPTLRVDEVTGLSYLRCTEVGTGKLLQVENRVGYYTFVAQKWERRVKYKSRDYIY